MRLSMPMQFITILLLVILILVWSSVWSLFRIVIEAIPPLSFRVIIGLPAFICIKVLAPGYFARQDTVTPVKIGIIALLTNIVLNLVLVSHLDHVGLALATSLSAWLNATLLWVGLKKKDLIILIKNLLNKTNLVIKNNF